MYSVWTLGTRNVVGTVGYQTDDKGICGYSTVCQGSMRPERCLMVRYMI